MKDMKMRTKKFAVDCWNLCEQLPKNREYNNLVFQLLKSSSSVAANWRASQRPKSEADETCFWLELIIEISKENINEAKRLWKECDELVRITVASIKTIKEKQKQNK